MSAAFAFRDERCRLRVRRPEKAWRGRLLLWSLGLITQPSEHGAGFLRLTEFLIK